MSNKLRITIDKMKCVGSTICIMELPDVFQLDEEMQSQVINPDGATREQILAAAGACPMSAIIVEDAETGGEAVSVEKLEVTIRDFKLKSQFGISR